MFFYQPLKQLYLNVLRTRRVYAGDNNQTRERREREAIFLYNIYSITNRIFIYIYEMSKIYTCFNFQRSGVLMLMMMRYRNAILKHRIPPATRSSPAAREILIQTIFIAYQIVNLLAMMMIY